MISSINNYTGAAGSLENSAAAVLTPARQLIQQIQNVINFTTWVDEEDLVKNLPAFLRTPDGEDNQIFTTLPETLDPLHRALYIHAHLGALDEIRQYYVNNRLPQVCAIINPSALNQYLIRLSHLFYPFSKGNDPYGIASSYTRWLGHAISGDAGLFCWLLCYWAHHFESYRVPGGSFVHSEAGGDLVDNTERSMRSNGGQGSTAYIAGAFYSGNRPIGLGGFACALNSKPPTPHSSSKQLYY